MALRWLSNSSTGNPSANTLSELPSPNSYNSKAIMSKPYLSFGGHELFPWLSEHLILSHSSFIRSPKISVALIASLAPNISSFLNVIPKTPLFATII